jgi:hypothetical protein
VFLGESGPSRRVRGKNEFIQNVKGFYGFFFCNLWSLNHGPCSKLCIIRA